MVFAFIAAVVLHFLIGVVVKRNALNAANPIPPASNAPVTMRFVDVPSQTKTVPVAPKTRNLSDANRVAGALHPIKPGEMKMPSIPGKQGNPIRQKPPEVKQQRAVQAPAPQMAQAQTPAPAVPPVCATHANLLVPQMSSVSQPGADRPSNAAAVSP